GAPELGARVRSAPTPVVILDTGAVLVTGGTRGIGKEIALRFASLGAKTTALGYLRNDSAAEAAAEEIRAAGAEPVLVRGNVASDRVIAELASHGPYDVIVHSAATGVIRPALETEALEHFPNRDQMLRAARERTPAGRMVEPEDVAGAVEFLCSPNAEMVRGQTLIVDGGYSLLV